MVLWQESLVYKNKFLEYLVVGYFDSQTISIHMNDIKNSV